MFGLIPLPWWGYLLVILALCQVTIFSVTIYLHRYAAHRALELHPIISHCFRFWLWLTTGMVTKEWAAIHRKHHAKVETADDPHSPVAKGIRKVFFEGAELYRKEARNPETLARYGEGLPNDWVERHVYSRHPALGISLMLIIDLVLFGTMGLTVWAIQMMWIPLIAAGVINGIGHYWGYRNYECKDASRNIIPFGLLAGGEELHNNHHAFATSAKFSAKWWEVDTGWLVICLLRCFGLAKAKRVVPKLKMITEKSVIDAETLRALINHRFQVMARYAREVITPVVREEKKHAARAQRSLLSRARTVLVRDGSLMRASQQVRLAKLLENFQSLNVVYSYRIKLQAIWSQSTATQKELLEALQEWCQQAEATGIETLSRFAQQLRRYA